MRLPLLPHPRFRLRRPRIATTLAAMFATTAALTTLATGLIIIRTSMNLAHKGTAERLEDAAELISGQLDADAISNLRDPRQRNSAVFTRTHSILSTAARDVGGVRFIYLLRKAKEPIKDRFSRYEFVVDGLPFDDKDFSTIGVVLVTSPTTDALHRVWGSGRFEADRRFVKDSWGTWLSGYIPLRKKDGTFETVLGIDISAQKVIDERNSIMASLLQALFIGLIIILPLAALVGRQISEPLRYVNQRLEAISRLEPFPEATPKITSDLIHEIHQIFLALRTVQTALTEFTTYVPTTLVHQLMLNRSSLNLRGEVRQLAIMFTDIRDFTSLCESMEPTQVLNLLNQYFAIIHEEASATQGVLDKYIGDSALLFWGAPEPIDQPAHACLEAALRCRDRLDALNDRWHADGLPVTFHTTFGIDYGSVVVGNIGPRERVNYTIIGDRVNLAQRLEHSNRDYGTRILASADLVQALGSATADYLIVKVDDAKLRGFSHTLAIYEVVGRRDRASTMEQLFSDTLNAAQAARDNRRFQDALVLLHSLPASLAQRPYVQQLIHDCDDQRSGTA